jgi:hypothetical protein
MGVVHCLTKATDQMPISQRNLTEILLSYVQMIVDGSAQATKRKKHLKKAM